MIEVVPEIPSLDRRTRIDLVKRLFQLIVDNSLNEIMQIFQNLDLDQCIVIINSSIHGFIPLYVAVDNNNLEISRYLIQISLFQGRLEMSERWKTCRHPLTPALNHGSQQLVELILQYLYDINDGIHGAYTPLMVAICTGNLNFVKLIVNIGADINQSGVQGRSPLMESTSNIEICQFLISQGANLSHRDDEGFTVLHIAASRNHTQSLICLINNGADVRTRNPEGITPLLCAIIRMDIPLIMYFLQHDAYSMTDKIESLELLNACFLCADISTTITWMAALHLRRLQNLPKNNQITLHPALDLSREFTTDGELHNLQHSPLDLAYQATLVIERVLGRNNRLYMHLLLHTALVAKEANKLVKVRELIDYIEEYSQEASVYSVANNLESFKTLFVEVGITSNPDHFFEYGGFVIFKMIAEAALEMWLLVKENVDIDPFTIDSYEIELVDTFLFMVSETEIENFSQQQLGQFRGVVTQVVEEDILLLVHQSLLHRAIKLMNTTSWSTVKLIKILLDCGANANIKDYFIRTPMMYALRQVPEHFLNDVLVLLFEHGGHEDCRSSEGFTSMDDIPWGRCLIPRRTPRSLQCLGIEVVLDYGIPYAGIVREILEDCINFHK